MQYVCNKMNCPTMIFYNNMQIVHSKHGKHLGVKISLITHLLHFIWKCTIKFETFYANLTTNTSKHNVFVKHAFGGNKVHIWKLILRIWLSSRQLDVCKTLVPPPLPQHMRICLTFGLDLLTWILISIIYSSKTVYLRSLKSLGQNVLDLSVAPRKL